MPFPQQNPIDYSAYAILNLEENQQGCYGIYRGNVCVYIGKGDIRARMLAHLNGDNPFIAFHSPTHWYGSVTSDMDNEEKRLILEQRPLCNRRVG